MSDPILGSTTPEQRVRTASRPRAKVPSWTAADLKRRLSTPAGIATMFGVAFVLRLLIAPHVGFYEDLLRFRVWAERLAEIGPGRFYSDPGLPVDYPPVYLYVLLVLGKLSRAVGAPIPSVLILKLPAIVGDLGLAWVVGALAARVTPASADRSSARALGAAAVLFNPAVIALSAVWGQVDAVPAAFVLGAFLLLFVGPKDLRRTLVASVPLSLGIAMKPVSVWMLPAFALGMLWRYRESIREASKHIGVLVAGASATLILAGLPFGLGPPALFRFYRYAASVYQTTSVWAFNLWGFVGFWRPDSAATSSAPAWSAFGIPALYVGLVLFVAGSALVLRRAYRSLREQQDDVRTVLFAAAALSLVGFAVLTRMHERYLFSALACLCPFVAFRWPRRALTVVSALFLVNLYFPFVAYNEARSAEFGVQSLRVEPLFGWFYGGLATDAWQKKAWSLLAFVACVWIAARGWRFLTEGSAGLASGNGFRWTLPVIARLRSIREAPAVRTDTDTFKRSQATIERGAQLGVLWDRVRPFVPLALAAAVVVFNLIVLRAEVRSAANLNDSAQHFQMLRWATEQLDHGRVPFDGWYRYLTLGSAAFHQYHSFPHILTAFFARVIGADAAFHWTLYLLLALWPLGVYAAARVWGFERWTAGAAAIVSPLLASASGYGFEHGSYTWQGYGIWPQLWAMWLLPFAWALSWRAVERKKGYALAALVVAMTIACHLILGYLALLSIGVWVVTRTHGVVRRALRAAAVGGGALVVASWVIVPLVADRTWSTKSIFYVRNFFADSYGARQILGWLFTGHIFDHGHPPVVTLLMMVGVVVCVRRWRDDGRARALLGVWLLSLVLFFGRPTLGPLLKLLPGNEDIQIHRFVAGVHMGGILLAGIGAVALAQLALEASRRFVPAPRRPLAVGVLATAAFTALLPAFAERERYNANGAALISAQRTADATDGADAGALIELAKARGGGRLYGGMRSGWGADYRVGSVPMYAVLANHDADGVGFIFRIINSLSTDIEPKFDDNNPVHMALYDVKYLIYPRDREPTVPVRPVATRGRHALWETEARGYLDLVDTTAPIAADRATLSTQVETFLRSELPSRRLYPAIAFAGRPATPTVAPGQRVRGSPGRIVGETDDLDNGVIFGEVAAERRSVVLLRESFHPRWKVFVDRVEKRPELIAPSFVGVTVPPGTHYVMFVYKPFGIYPILFALGALTLLALYAVPGYRRRSSG